MTSKRSAPFPISLPLILIGALLVLLWIAGGASREDAMGQVVVRTGAWIIIACVLVTGSKPVFAEMRPLVLVLVAVVMLAIFQLMPLPPGMWQNLPGRDILVMPGEAPPWRPLTMTPGATRNALSSLVVPAAMLLLLTQTNEREREFLVTVLLAVIASTVFLGLLQFSGLQINNPLINDVAGNVSSIFANRNHFALFVAVGCLLAPIWALNHFKALHWRGPIAAGLVLLFILTILAIGSRSGLLLAALALAIAAAATGGRLKRLFKGAPRWIVIALAAAGLSLTIGFIWASFAADRVEAVDRLFASAIGDDLRWRARPTIVEMIKIYFPVGSGLGGFDPVFRIHEPDTLLALQYLNQAHNEFLGVALDAGVPGILVLAAAVGWWGFSTVAAWRAPFSSQTSLARLGSGIMLLVFVASITDYPARTPMVMAIIVIAAAWLATGSRHSRSARATLPSSPADL